MSRLFNNINKGFSRIFRVLLFILSAFLIIYFFPKSGKFKYSFENGRPWQSENLYAPFDFAIKKTNDEISLEINQAKINTPLFFDIDTSLTSAIPIISIIFIGNYLGIEGNLADFAIPLLIGIISGTYSSIFVTIPFLSKIIKSN